MPKGHVILTEAINDPEGMKAYAQAAVAAMGGVSIIAVDAAPRWTRPAHGTGPRPTKTQRSCAKPQPTATQSSSPDSRCRLAEVG
jgi:hypothetical protein